VLIALDFALLAFTLLYPNPLAPFAYPPQMGVSFGNFVYFYILLAGLAFGFQPRKVLWGGVAGAVAWLAGIGWLVALPDTSITPPGGGTVDAQLALLADPTFVSLDAVARDVVVFVLVAGMMSVVVERSRRLVERQASLERQRSNLARYFPPATVDRLANQDRALGQTREEDAAVLFFDLVGFTHWAESHSPAEVIRLLREVHGRVESAIFTHDGTLDKFIGDGAMATFGTVEPGPREATNALACAVAIVDEFRAWNAERSRRGEAPVRVSIGVHHGRVVVGDIGTDRRLELAVLGDAVNVASRLEELTRQLGCSAVISGAAAGAARGETGAEAAALLGRFREAGRWGLRGRDEAVEVLAYG
jgi:adenylate cyclase